MTTVPEWPDKIAQPEIAYEPDLIPPLHLMATEGVVVLEDWFRWAEEWSMILRIYGGITAQSSVLEIGCGLGRIAFPLRYILLNGSYEGFEICRDKIVFLNDTFQKAHPNFRFTWANVRNTYYNPEGQTSAPEYRFPYPRNSFDLIFAASVFTHMLPDAVANYFEHSARVLKQGGRCVFSFFLLDNYRQGHPRPLVFGRDIFNFDHQYGDYGDEFATVVPENPEQMTAYRLSLIERFASQAGLELERAPVPGLWSGQFPNWVCAQDLVVLRKPGLLPNS
jgi:SAM-dependent methyltransferase